MELKIINFNSVFLICKVVQKFSIKMAIYKIKGRSAPYIDSFNGNTGFI